MAQGRTRVVVWYDNAPDDWRRKAMVVSQSQVGDLHHRPATVGFR